MKVINEALKSAILRGLPNSLKPLIHSFIKRTTTDKEELPLCCRLQGYLFNPLRKQSGGKNTQEGRYRGRVSAVSGASRSHWQWGVLQLVISSRSQLSMNAGRESRSCLREVRLVHTQTPYHSHSHTRTRSNSLLFTTFSFHDCVTSLTSYQKREALVQIERKYLYNLDEGGIKDTKR